MDVDTVMVDGEVIMRDRQLTRVDKEKLFSELKLALDRPLSPDELEPAFEMIAQALDRAGADKEVELLAKLALELAYRLGDVQALAEALDVAARDLEDGAA